MSAASRRHESIEDELDRMDGSDTFRALRRWVEAGKPDDFDHWLYAQVEQRQRDYAYEDGGI